MTAPILTLKAADWPIFHEAKQKALRRSARTLTVCYEAGATDGRVWAVRDGRRWFTASHVSIQVPMTSVAHPSTARQPRAYFTGTGRVTWCGSRAVLTP